MIRQNTTTEDTTTEKMTLKSMTGFARRDGARGTVRWHWELRSVNGRGLDLRLRLAPGAEGLEHRLREATQKRVARGNVSVTLAVQRDTGASEIRLNEAALDQVLAALRLVRQKGDFEKPRAEAVLALRGVLEAGEPVETEIESEARLAAMLADYEAALEALVENRAREGARLAAVLADQISQIEALVARVAASPSRGPEAVRRRLEEQVRRLIEAAPSLDQDRLHQEAVLIATRIDIEEEVARLTAHVAAARELLVAKEPIGRKLDFLAQEFNREANTLCSKANDVEITRTGLELKVVIDQMREQVQNIE